VSGPSFWADSGSGIFRAKMTTPVSRVPALALALSLVALSACDKGKDSEGEAKPDDKTADKAGDKTVEAATTGGDATKTDATKTDAVKPDGGGGTAPNVPVPASNITVAGGDGVAYVATNSKGIAKLDASGWSMVLDNKTAYFSKMYLGADGNVYVVDFEAVKKIDGNALVEVAKFDYNTFSGASYVATGRDGTAFAAAYNKYGVGSGGKWTTSELSAIAADIESLTGVAVAGDNTVWVAGSKSGGSSLHFNKANAGTWAALDLSPLGESFYFSQLSGSPTGDVFVTNGQYLAKLTPEKAEKIEFKTADGSSWASYSTDMAFNAAGHVLAGSSMCELVKVDFANPGDQWTVGKGGYNCQTLQAVALDGQNRAWVSSKEGLTVIAPDKTVQEYANSSVMELVGSYVTDIVVVGNGPALPAPGPLHVGGVTGKALVEGTPVANAKVEMCTSPSWGGSQPCFDAKVKFVGTTNDKGEFTFEGVPIANYTVNVEIKGKWQMYTLSNIATEMKEGTTYDVGSVKFSAG
jgi:hypothetical protein